MVGKQYIESKKQHLFHGIRIYQKQQQPLELYEIEYSSFFVAQII